MPLMNAQAPKRLQDPWDIPSNSYLTVPGVFSSTFRAEDVPRDGRLSTNALPIYSLHCSSESATSPVGIDVEQQHAGFDATSRTTLACPAEAARYSVIEIAQAKEGHDSCKVFWNCVRNLYHILLFGIPHFYKYRVLQIFWEVSYVESEVMSELVAQLGRAQIELDLKLATMTENPQQHYLSPQEFYALPENTKLKNLKMLWESFINKCIREWKAGNLIAILLLA
ncbi:hypothetical protein H0H92_014300, partial [Tricholoma furcatifolium]